jgi:hypothetical protein
MNQDNILKKIAKDSGVSLNKTKIALTALSGGINACLKQGLFTLEIPPGAPDTRKTFDAHFRLAGLPAVVQACEISHLEMSIVVAVPNDKCRDPFAFLSFPRALRDNYDLICSGWLERKTGKFVQGVVSCSARKKPWIAAIADLKLKTSGFAISTKFFR